MVVNGRATLVLFCAILGFWIRANHAQDILPVTTNRGLGGILTWGLNDRGQLQFGDGVVNTTVDLHVPTPLTNLPLSPRTNAKVVVTDAAGGGKHTLIATEDGDVYAVGGNEHGQLGVGDLFDRDLFTLIDTFRDAPGALWNGVDVIESMGRQHVIKVAAGESHSAALTDQGKLWIWGTDDRGRLGLGCMPLAEEGMLDPWDDVTNFVQPVRGKGANQLPGTSEGSFRRIDTEIPINCVNHGRKRVPHLVEGLAQTYTDQVYLGKHFSVALTGMCSADTFSDGSCLPLEDTSATIGAPVLNFVVASSLGSGAALLLSEAGVDRCTCGQVWVWGSNEFGQLGLGDELPRLQPTLVTALSGIGVHITAVAVGTYHVIALSSKGNVYVWGYNANGQLGTTNTIRQPLPVRVRKPEPGFLFASNIAAGAYHSIIVSDRGDVYAFGSNRNGQLGNGQADLLPHPTPVRMDGLPLLRGLRVECGAYHCLAVTLALEIYTWGWNKYGQLGTGLTSDLFKPTLLPLPAGIPGFAVTFATGYAHAVVVLQTGDLTYCGLNRWGKNVCARSVQLASPVTTDQGGVWRVVSATVGRIVVAGNEALEFEATGNIQLYRNETDLGVYAYTSVKNLENYQFAFESIDLAFDTRPFVPDAVWSTSLLL